MIEHADRRRAELQAAIRDLAWQAGTDGSVWTAVDEWRWREWTVEHELVVEILRVHGCLTDGP